MSLADNGREALEALEELVFDLVLMDVQMPEMDGFEATAAIRAREEGTAQRTPIIGLTAHAMPGDRQRCLDAGMDDYVPKPIQPGQLFAAVEAFAAPADEGTDGQDAAADFDRQAVLDYFENDVDLVGRMVELFFEDYPKYLIQVEEAIERGDAEGLRRAAHSLKTPVGTMSLGHALQRAQELEDMGKTGDLAQAPPVFTALEDEVERLKPALLAFCGLGATSA